MANDTIGKMTNIVELGLLVGLAYLGYKAYKEFFPGKDPAKPPTPASTAGDVAQTLLDLTNKERPTTGSPGQDLVNSVIIPKPLQQVLTTVEEHVEPELQKVPGYTWLQGVQDTIVKSPLVQWNPAFPQFWGNALDLLTGAAKTAAPTANASQISVNDALATKAIEQTRQNGFASIVTGPGIPAKTFDQVQYEKAAASPLKTASQGGTGIFNNSLGQVISLDQMTPQDRITMDKTAEQMLRDYGTTNGLPLPTAAPAAPKAGEWWQGPQMQVLRAPEGTVGWRKLSQAEAAARGYY